MKLLPDRVLTRAALAVFLVFLVTDRLNLKMSHPKRHSGCGYTEPQGQRTGFGALLLGYYQSANLNYAGKVGTGYDRETLRRLGGQLEKLETSDSPFAADGVPSSAHWVKPTLVAQIAFAEWTRVGKLRQPRFLGAGIGQAAQKRGCAGEETCLNARKLFTWEIAT